MKTLNQNTQKAKHYVNAYEKSSMYSLYDLYKNPSVFKVRAENQILGEMNNYNEIHKKDGIEYRAYGYKVLGGNTSTFTCGYTVDKISTETGEVLYSYLRIETACNTYKIYLF